jgi:nitrate/TMAO reductase-like tetraheme cytochrome c subunit
MNPRILLALIVVVIFFLMIDTNITSIFTASHSLTNISQPGNQISCETCHSQIQRELNNSTYHRDLTCEACHRYNASITFASDNGVVQPGNESHAAYLPRCLDCHGGNGVYIYNKTNSLVYAPPAKAFNLTNYGSNYSAHKKFVIDSNNFSAAKGENEACLSCHTGFDINLTFQYPEYVNVSIYTDGSSTDGLLFQILNVEFGPNRSYNVILNREGSKHTLVPLSNITCIYCHENIYKGGLGSSIGRQHAGDVTDKGQDPGIHQTMPVDNDWCISCHFNQTFASYSAVHVEEVHAAEKIRCTSCHSSQGPYPPVNETPGRGHHNSTYFYPQFLNYPSLAEGDICISCHLSLTHTSYLPTTNCGCHNSGYYINSTIYREPKANETTNWMTRNIN